MNVSDLKICMGKETSGEKPCLFDISDLGPCALPNFGYDNNTPCVYLKLNKVKYNTLTSKSVLQSYYFMVAAELCYTGNVNLIYPNLRVCVDQNQ
jgi:hypothetical protein